MGFKTINDFSCQDFLPKYIVNANAVVCATYQAGKSHIKPPSTSGKAVKGKIKGPGDLIHIKQASGLPGKPLKHSGKNKKQKIFFVAVFVEGISKKDFYEFQHSTDSEETIKAKRNMKRDAKT